MRPLGRHRGSGYRAALPIGLAAGLALGGPAYAHGGYELPDGGWWAQWSLLSVVTVLILVVGVVYVAGAAELRDHRDLGRRTFGRHLLFGSGLLGLFLSLQSPIDPIAEHLFSIHQVQHLLLRMIAPMLMTLARPQPFLVAGLPRAARRAVLSPLLRNRAIGSTFAFITRPVFVFLLFAASLIVWQIPSLHDLAVLNEPAHWTMHITMLAAGLLFWWRIFDHRAPPAGLRYGIRMMLIWLTILTNILLGAYLTLQPDILYSAYDITGRLWGLSPLADERIGAVTIWVPGSMMCILAAIAVIHMWGRYEERPRSQAAVRRPGNSVLALGFGTFALAVFLVAIVIGILNGG